MSKQRAERSPADAALLFAALGDETRLGLLQRLSRGGPASISALAERFRVTRQGVTKHLHVLAAAGVIEGRREGRQHVWALNPTRLAEAGRCLETIARGWDDALSRLKAHLEDT
ncbi:MAG: metalloregulator ArsR/SmtB family transcription factor [Luteitalea sp.]|nr:metalloregulator ArsR/SmtB family transcription factor [Luteitalea sp.]